MPGTLVAKAIIDDDPPALLRDTNGVQAKPVGDRAPADRNEHGIGREHGGITPRRRLDVHGEIRRGSLDLGHLVAEMETKALFLQHALKLLGDFSIGARQNTIQEFDDGHLGAKPAPDRAKFETDHAGANDEKLFGDALQG